jgi:hypothetical protein
MEDPVLIDKKIFPTEEIIFSHLGKSKILWQSIFEYIHENHPELTEQWKFYNDGKRWLLKVTLKTKTIFWVSVMKDTFIMTFYFTDKAELSIMNSPISDILKEQFKTGKRFNKIRGLTILFKYKRDIEYAKSIIRLKLNTK